MGVLISSIGKIFYY